MENASLHVSKETYFEMCEMLGNEPNEEEIPVEYDDFQVEVQQALSVYRALRDEWDPMAGAYLGKSFIGIHDTLDAAEIDLADRKHIVSLVRLIDEVRSELINAKQAQQKPAS